MRTVRPERTYTGKDQSRHIYTTVCQPPSFVPGIYVRDCTNRFGCHWLDNKLTVEISHHNSGEAKRGTLCYCVDAKEGTHWINESVEVSLGEKGMIRVLGQT